MYFARPLCILAILLLILSCDQHHDDVGLANRFLLNNPFQGSEVIGYPRHMLYLTGGLTYLFNTRHRYRWMVRPYAQYGLNRKASCAPMHLTPYAFGIGVGVEW